MSEQETIVQEPETAAPVAPVSAQSPTDKALEKLGVTRTLVEELKKNFGCVQLSFIAGEPYLLRPLFRRELRHLKDPAAVQDGNDMHLEEAIAIQCVIAPKFTKESIVLSRAGLASSIAALVYNISGFDIDTESIEL